MSAIAPTEHLAPDAALRLAEFARACKAAARAVSLYPVTHPAIRLSIGRLSDTAAKATAAGPLALGILPDGLRLEGLSSARPDAAIGELAALLHQHLVGGLTVRAGATAEVWLPFFVMLARPADELREAGGIARVWKETGSPAIEIEAIDYSEILRERPAGDTATLDEIIANCLQTDAIELDDRTTQALLDIAGDPDRLAELVLQLEEDHGGGRLHTMAAALLRMLKGITDAVARTAPERMESVLRNMSVAVGGLSPALLMELLSGERERAEGAADLILQVVNRMTDETIASFVADNLVADRRATGRLAQAFQALVPETDRRRLLLEMAASEVATSPLGSEAGFPELMSNAKDMLMTYSDEPFISEEYARQLTSTRTQAVEVERTSDDPPDRVLGWIDTVSETSLRALDLRLLLDLLAIEANPDKWRDVVDAAVFHIEDLLLVGDFGAALQLVEVLVREAGPEGDGGRRPAAAAAVERLIHGHMMRNQAVDLRTMDDQAFELVTKICHTIGPAIIPPLAEALSVEGQALSRQRLATVLIGFGSAGRQSVERLKSSANPAVRRTAVYLLREFGGSEALPDLTTLLNDAEPHIQRDALRAIVAIGTEQAYDVLRQAMATGSETMRNSLMLALVAMRDERAAPLFGHIIRHVDYWSALGGVYLRSIEALGALRDEGSIALLKDTLYQGRWWSPLRTAKLRATAAAALKRVGTPAAIGALEEAAAQGPRGVRSAARAELA